jgi:hypothetical protein
VAAVRELEAEYEGRFKFEIIPPEETLKRAEELGLYDLGSHGLVVLDPKGKELAHLPGHEFGRAEIEAAMQAAMR